MSVNSRQVSSNQQGIHPRLAAIVRRHHESKFRRPVAPHSEEAFGLLLSTLQCSPRPLILDSFCGTGHSTAILAQRHPQHLVVGIDQSQHRLEKHQSGAAKNYLLLQANCEDIWQLLLRHKLSLDFHYLLYPNPWPKKAHLQRRIHGHASFPWLLQLGGTIELRSNWQLYVEEFGVAMQISGRSGYIAQTSGNPAITLFEEKYRSSGHPLWCFRCAARKVTQHLL